MSEYDVMRVYTCYKIVTVEAESEEEALEAARELLNSEEDTGNLKIADTYEQLGYTNNG